MSEPIQFWNRETRSVDTEKVLGEGAVRWLYGSRLGQKLVDSVLSRRFISEVYGLYQSSPASRRKIARFVREFDINLDEYEGAPYSSFNDFFIRKFKPGARPFVEDESRLAAFAEARYLAFERIDSNQLFPVKGSFLTAEALLGKAGAAAPFIGGPMLLARLCPVDYHRFHFPDDGRTEKSWRVPGRLHSVNPWALKYRGEIFATNERQVSILETRNFGRLAYIEVGALCVGRIVQSWKVSEKNSEFLRGIEKGYFLFGGSTVIVLGEPGRWRPDADLLEQTARKRETFAKLGSAIATRL
ncbi:MAG: phosphatidylserine decarboxylase [Oligoflexia bacterium]|nr:phosphatidylserine decarboxylase [Oligoflexia bacterium]